LLLPLVISIFDRNMKILFPILLLFLLVSAEAQDKIEFSKNLSNIDNNERTFVDLGRQFNSTNIFYLGYNMNFGANNAPSFLGFTAGFLDYKGGFWLTYVTNKYALNSELEAVENALYNKQVTAVTNITIAVRDFINPMFSMYYGVGYGKRDFYYLYDKPEPGFNISESKSSSGILLEIGTMINLKNNALTFGVNIIEGDIRTLNFNLGIGRTIF
jgi:hypothetical protein